MAARTRFPGRLGECVLRLPGPDRTATLMKGNPMNLAAVLEAARVAIESDVPFMLHGEPGIGKTEGIEGIAADMGMPSQTDSLGTMESVDLRGLPGHDGKGGVAWSKPDFLVRLEALAAASPTGRVLWFVDEINTNGQAVQVPLMQAFRKRSIGPHALPAGVRLAAAGNRMQDRAAAQRMGTALNNRLLHLDVDNPANPDGVKDWARWAAGAQIHPAVIAFIMLRGAPSGIEGQPGFQPGLIHHMEPNDPNARAFPSPRSWSEVSKIMAALDNGAPERTRLPLVTGLVGDKAATEFDGFVRVWKSIPPVHAIVSNPNGAKVPSEPSAQYAVAMALARAAASTPSHFAAVLQYMKRVGKEFEIVTVTDAVRRNPDLTDSGPYVTWTAANSDITI